MRISLRTGLLVAFLLSASSCGWVFVNGPPPNHSTLPYFSCTESKTAPILDVIWGGLNLLGAASALATSEEDWAYDYSYDRSQVVVVGLGWTVVSGLAARSGFDKVNRCRAALLELGERTSEPDAGTPTVTVFQPWWPPMLFPATVLSPSPGNQHNR